MNRFHKPNYISRDLIAKSQIRHLVTSIFRTARCRCGPPRRGTYLRPVYIYVNGEEIPSAIIIWKEKFRTYSCPSLPPCFPRPQSPSDRSTMRTCILGCIFASLIFFAWVDCDPRSPKGGGRGDSREGKCKYPYKIKRRWHRGARR